MRVLLDKVTPASVSNSPSQLVRMYGVLTAAATVERRSRQYS